MCVDWDPLPHICNAAQKGDRVDVSQILIFFWQERLATLMEKN